MNTPAPASKALELYNRLVRLPFSNKEEIGRLAWQLRALRQRNNHDTEAAVALFVALTMLGTADEARSLSRELWNYRFQMPPQVLGTYMASLFHVGEWDNYLSLAGTINGGPPLPSDERLYSYVTGDSARLMRLIQQKDNDPRLSSFVQLMTRIGLIDHFPGHQAVVNSVLEGRFTHVVHALFGEEESDEMCLNTFFFLDAPFKERRLLETSIDDALANYYFSLGLDPTIYSPYLNTLVCDVTAHPAIISYPTN